MIVGPRYKATFLINDEPVIIRGQAFILLLLVGCLVIGFSISLFNLASIWIASVDEDRGKLGAALFMGMPLSLLILGYFEKDDYERGFWYAVSITNLFASCWWVTRLFKIDRLDKGAPGSIPE